VIQEVDPSNFSLRHQEEVSSMNEYLAWHNITDAVSQLPLWVWPMLTLALIARALPQPRLARKQSGRQSQGSQRSQQRAHNRR